MAIDHALLDLAALEGAVFLRLYRWRPFCLSFGRHEPALLRYRRERIDALGLDCVRRPTGGRAVWHARELTYAVAAPASFGSLAETYDRIHRMLAESLRILGADPIQAPRPARVPGPGAGACFAAPVGGEILITGRKVVGSAQLRSNGALLQHGSMLLEDDQQLVHQLSQDGGTTSSASGLAEAPLARLLRHPVAFEDAADAIRQASRAWTDRWEELSAAQVVERAGPYLDHYRDPARTWSR